jgi:hypothetical protein
MDIINITIAFHNQNHHINFTLEREFYNQTNFPDITLTNQSYEIVHNIVS